MYEIQMGVMIILVTQKAPHLNISMRDTVSFFWELFITAHVPLYKSAGE